MEEQALQNHLVAIEMYICHLGKTFEEACEELNLDITEQLALKYIMLESSISLRGTRNN